MFGGRIDNKKLPMYIIGIVVLAIVVYFACCGCCSVLGLPLIALGFLIRCWYSKCCGSTTCSTDSDS